MSHNKNSPMEIFVRVEQAPKYLIGDKGSVISLNYRGSGKPEFLSPGESGGYKTVNLYKKGWSKSFHIHRLVAHHFLSKPKNKKVEVDHVNGNKEDNRVENLEWVSHKENMERARKNNQWKCNKKLSKEEVEQIKKLYINSDITQKQISEKFDISRSAVNSILKGRSWQHLKDQIKQEKIKKASKKKSPKGERGANKITKKEAQKIKKIYNETEKTQKEVAKLFDITRRQVGYIVNRKRWNHLSQDS